MQMIEYFESDTMLQLYEGIKRYTFETNSEVEIITLKEAEGNFYYYKFEAIVVFRTKEVKNDK